MWSITTGTAQRPIAGASETSVSGAQNTGNLRDAIPFMRALVQAAPQRVVWGSDWPHIGFHAREQVRDDSLLPHRDLDAGELLDLLSGAVPDRALRDAILVDNPQALYFFP